MTAADPPLESAEDLYENAPCGYLSCGPDGTVVRVNRTFESLTGHTREELVGRRFSDLLTPAGRIYHETHLAPLLRMQGAVREIALDVVRRDGTRVAVLVNATVVAGPAGTPSGTRISVFNATDRRRYEQELLAARRREQETALELQRSLLAGELPQAPGLAVEPYYRPAIAGTEAGGDWYDAFWLDEERIALTVGDVVGRGLQAAATMGQLRSAIRALASTGLRPGRLLEALDRYASQHGVGRMTTLLVAQLELSSGALRYAAAGHPPPVLIDADGPRFLSEGRSVPVDSALSTGERPEGGAIVGRRSVLLLYTDGLVERRDRPLHAGLDQLLAAVASGLPELDLSVLARRMGTGAVRDDVCALAVRRAG